MKTPHIFLLFVLGVAALSCAPVFSSLQSAKLVGKDNIDIAPHYTSTSGSENNESEHIQDHFGLQLAYGVSNEVDIVTRYEYIDVQSLNANIIGIGPKINITKDKVAAYIPIGFAFGTGDGISNFQVQPTMLFTLPLGEYIEFNPSFKGIIGEEFYLAGNIGLGLSTNLKKYVVRPEYGMLIKPGEKGHYGQFSIGTSFYIKELFSKKD